MQIIQFNKLVTIIQQIFIQLGFCEHDAKLLAHHLAEANLLGHHSHGVIRLPIYYQRIREGRINPRAKMTVDEVSPTIAFVQGNGALGQLASIFASDVAIKKAKTARMAAVGINTVDHTCRLGAYV